MYQSKHTGRPVELKNGRDKNRRKHQETRSGRVCSTGRKYHRGSTEGVLQHSNHKRQLKKSQLGNILRCVAVMIESPKTPYKHSYPEEEVEKLSLHSNHLSIDQSHKYWVDNITNATDLTTLTDDLFTSSLSSLSSQCSYTDSMHESDSQDTVPPKVATTTEIYSNHHRPSSYLPTSSPVDMNLIIEHGHQLSIRDIQVSDVILGEGQMGIVFLASYKGQHVACKRRRQNKSRYLYEIQVQRELYFAARLSICRYVNRYLGWVYCHMDDIEGKRQTNNKISSRKKNNEIYVVQRYVPNKDGRRYLDKRQSKFLLVEAVQAAICLFSALTDAHRMNIGIVDLKLENFLIDASGSGWLTDFGSCVEIKNNLPIQLQKEEVCWTKTIAAPEMLRANVFTKASDVFMATIIVAEMITSDLTDDEFSKKVIRRHKSGNVDFQSSEIDLLYKPLFPLISAGLDNNIKTRPTSEYMLGCLLKMKDDGLDTW